MTQLRVLACSIVAAVTCLLWGSVWAASNSVAVPGVTDIWLAGQPNGTILVGGFPSNDVAPANSPVLASTGLNLTAGSFLTFAVTGTTNFNGCASPSPDGGGACGTPSSGPFFGIASYSGPINALVGVFLDNNVPGGVAPAGLNFVSPAAQSAAMISPLLNQVFFIGDGLTGTGSGSVQQFVIPAGATRLFLASLDGGGASYNNSGAFSVTVTDAAGPSGPAAPVPAMSEQALLALGILLAAFAALALRGSAGGPRRRQ